MRLIHSVEIRYLRSIHRLRLSPLGDLTVFSGANDVGKSNILKALNLFFNDCVDWQVPFDFARDFSLRRLNEVRKRSIKGRQFVRIDITFIRPPNYAGSLPPRFTVARTWFRDSWVETDDLERYHKQGRLPGSLATAHRMLSQFLNRVRFEYIPAIRARQYFEYILGNLQEILLVKQMHRDDPIISAVRQLNENLSARAAGLRQDFQSTTGIEADVSLPSDPNSLFRALSVSTKWQDSQHPEDPQDEALSLSLRGDGIQAVYVPLLLKYIADNSSMFHVWGFEEPENSIEYNLAMDLASAFETVHCNGAQVLLTSHSPAFTMLRGPNTVSYRVHKRQNATEAIRLYPIAIDPMREQLSEDIGLFRLQEQFQSEYEERRQEYHKVLKEVTLLRGQLQDSTRPVVCTEGKTDKTILETAWSKLFPTSVLPYIFRGCDPLPENQERSAGGGATLSKLLSVIGSDSPYFAVGVFDRDRAGLDAYNNLPKYFDVVADTEGVKMSQSGKAGATLLPIPVGKEEYCTWSNLCLEYYFDDGVLSRQTEDGRGLTFKASQLSTKDDFGHTIKTHVNDSPYARRITGGKRVFAEEIVPMLEAGAFENFRLLFERIDAVLTLAASRAP